MLFFAFDINLIIINTKVHVIMHVSYRVTLTGEISL